MKVVDPHIHLWDTRAVRYPWLENPGVAYSGDNRGLPQIYDVAAFLKDAQGIEVVASVNIEANPADPVSEARWLQSFAGDSANRGHPSGIVAYTDLSRPDAPAVLEKLADCGNLRGIRQILNVHRDPVYNYVNRDYLEDSRWRENLARLAGYGWSFDLQIYPGQAPAAAAVMRANANILFIVNHAGMFVDRNEVNGWREWRDGLRVLASQENCAIKLSGFAMFDHRWTIDSFRPLVLEAIDCFGVEDCMFASNFPIDGLHSSYGTLWQAYEHIVAGTTVGERDKLFIHNATRCYRLASSAGPSL
jgi:predicted TIM-barrel fold metal-dependent hydrolase